MKTEVTKNIIFTNDLKIQDKFKNVLESNLSLFKIKYVPLFQRLKALDLNTNSKNVLFVNEKFLDNENEIISNRRTYPTIIITSSTLNIPTYMVQLEADLFNSENFNATFLHFLIKEAVEKHHLYQKTNILKTKIEFQQNFSKELLAATTNQLKEPLLIIDKYTDLFRQRYEFSLDKIGHQFLNYLSRETAFQYEQLSRLVDYLTLDIDNQLIESLNVNDIIQDTLNAIEGIQEAPFLIHFENLPIVNYHRYALFVLFNELISNAIKFRKLNTVVNITITAIENETAWIFKIIDDGEGFDIQKATQVFELYQKLHNKFLYKGVGIGLPMCKKIVESYGGEIIITSVVDEGTEVQFSILK